MIGLNMFTCRPLLLLSLLLIAIIGGQTETFPCRLRDAQYGKVCVCTADYCDYLDNPILSGETEFVLISSSKQGLRFDKNNGNFGATDKFIVNDYEELVPQSPASNATIMSELMDQVVASIFTPQQAATTSSITRSVKLQVDRSKRYQRIEGFGGSFTGSVSYILEQYNDTRIDDHLYKSYYSSEGLGFNLLRTSIGGCDFDLSPWSYGEETDLELKSLDKLDDRDVIRVAQMKRLRDISGVKNLRVKAAAWSAPPWMKTNNKWTGFGQLKREYYQLWADYHLKWVDLMESNGWPIWAISTGNEPTNGVLFMFFVRFMSMGWTPQMQGIWVNDNLGPTIRNSKYKDLFIFGNDDQRYTSPLWFKQMNKTRPGALKYIDGVALHWYWDEIFDNSFVSQTTDYMRDKIQIISESCIGDKPWQKTAPLLGSWDRGEKVARSFLDHLLDGFHGWIDWNIILNEAGGPNYVSNFVDAPVIANTTTYTEFYKQPMFYVMGHVSKLVPEGSIRIDTKVSNVNLKSVAFQRPDGQVVCILFNSGRADLDIFIEDSLRGNVTVNVPAKSIHTLYYN